MKKLANLKGAKALNKKEQRSINGGRWHCDPEHECPPGYYCYTAGMFGDGYCVRAFW